MLNCVREHFGKDFVSTFETIIMEQDFVRIEKELALEAWMLQTFRLEDKILEEDLVIEGWLNPNIAWFELN